MQFPRIEQTKKMANRVRLKIISWLGYREPHYVRRRGKWFNLMHSAGPAPWESDGSWRSFEELLNLWKRAIKLNQLSGWYDVQAM